MNQRELMHLVFRSIGLVVFVVGLLRVGDGVMSVFSASLGLDD
ncbi:MAG: hypothetical protein AAF235_09415 [Planctomycetota bacterium]